MANYQYNPLIEQWKPIKGHTGYEVSDHGKIRSYHKNLGNGKYGVSNEPQRILKLQILDGYPIIVIDRKALTIHRLVLQTFLGPCPDGCETCHNDGNRTNNHYNNLRWDTRKNNIHDNYNHGTGNTGSRNGSAIATEEQIKQIRSLYAQGGITQKDIGKIYGLAARSVGAIVNRENWKHIP